VLPAHDENTCSMCAGNLRLALREQAAQVSLPKGRKWDLHFNISPLVREGHFLGVPDMSHKEGRRKQELLQSDCEDMVHLHNSLPSYCVNFNAPGAGATQNHVHIHAWRQTFRYPVETAPQLQGTEEWSVGECQIQLLDYPASVVKLSSPRQAGSAEETGGVIFALLEAAKIRGGVSWNVVLSRGDAYVFLRSGEKSDAIPGLTIGCAQLMGFWTVDTTAQFDTLRGGAIRDALTDTSVSTAVASEIVSAAVLTTRLLNHCLEDTDHKSSR